MVGTVFTTDNKCNNMSAGRRDFVAQLTNVFKITEKYVKHNI